MLIRINKREYEVTKADRFLDDGKSVQLLTQSKEPMQGGRRPNPVLSKRESNRLRASGVTETKSRSYRGVELRILAS